MPQCSHCERVRCSLRRETRRTLHLCPTILSRPSRTSGDRLWHTIVCREADRGHSWSSASRSGQPCSNPCPDGGRLHESIPEFGVLCKGHFAIPAHHRHLSPLGRQEIRGSLVGSP